MKNSISFVNQIIAFVICALGVILGTILGYLYGVFSCGFVVYKFWNWFILPIFTNLPSINVWQGVGLVYFCSVIMPKHVDLRKIDPKEMNPGMILFYAFIPWISLFFGCILKSFFLS